MKYEDMIAPNGNPCVVCGKPVNFMLKGEEDRKDIVHVFCWMWGHSIDEHDYENPKVTPKKVKKV